MPLRTLLTTAMIAMALVPAAPVDAADFPPGMGLDNRLEKQLTDALTELVELAKADKPDCGRVVEKVRSARKVAAVLLAKAKNRKPIDPVAVKLPPTVPVVLMGSADVEQARRLWLEQLRMCLNAAHGMMLGKQLPVREWIGWPNLKNLPKRALPVTEALREAEKAALLLGGVPDRGVSRLGAPAKAETLRVKPGKQLFADDFSKGAENWLPFGAYKARNEGDAFRFTDTTARHPDAMMWTKKEFDGNFVAEFTFIPHSAGARPGALFTICGRPRPGKDLSACVGESMATYNYGIDGYHFSMHRGNTGLGNARRVGTGLKMLASGPDPCPKVGRAYRVAVAKWDNVLLLVVDGVMIHNYFDAGTYGPVLAAGRIGLRHWAGCDASYKDFRVYRLERDRKVSELIEPKGKALFEERFKNLDNWRHEGGGTMALDAGQPGTLRIECIGSRQGKAGSQAFCLTDLPDGIAVEYDLKLLTKNGLAITFLAMKGSKGEDMFDPAQPKREGVFGDYVRNERLVSYHVSVSRYGDDGRHTGVSNWRRNPGLNLMGQGPDLCKQINRWYRIRIVKDGGHCQLGVDGRLAHEFTDPGKLPAPMPTDGKVGFRAIGAEVRMLVRNFKVTALR